MHLKDLNLVVFVVQILEVFHTGEVLRNEHFVLVFVRQKSFFDKGYLQETESGQQTEQVGLGEFGDDAVIVGLNCECSCRVS